VHESISATDRESTQDIHRINVRQLCESTGVSVLAIDQGTSGTKAIVVDEAGTVLALAEEPVRPQYLAVGAVEQSPIELLDSVLAAGRRAIDEAGVPIEVISLANQGETVLAWDPATACPPPPGSNPPSSPLSSPAATSPVTTSSRRRRQRPIASILNGARGCMALRL